jgi:uncharacterized protein YbcV (DUF1398 family)
MNAQAIHAVMMESQAGKLRFPEVVSRLMEAGVESYFVDFARGQDTIYMADGKSHTEAMVFPMKPIAEDFSHASIVAAIRGAQADTIRYPEFAERSAAAGVIAYWAFLTGRKVVYFGRKGEAHTEEFPALSKP